MTITDAINKFAKMGEIPNEIAPKMAKVLESNFGPLIGSYLGGGGKGFAWKFGGNLVLKITSDKQEAWAASALLNKYHQHVGGYKRVAQVGHTPLYAIIQDFAGDPMTDNNIKKAIDNLPDNSKHLIATLKELTQSSSHPIWSQLLSGIQWIRDHGIKSFDLHSDNVVQKGDVYKIIDVGIGDPEPMHLGRIELEHKLNLAMSNNIEIIVIGE